MRISQTGNEKKKIIIKLFRDNEKKGKNSRKLRKMSQQIHKQ